MKKQIATITTALLLLGLVSTPAWAGPARRHTIEGFALGAGAVLLGTAIINNMSKPAPVARHYVPAPRHRGHGHRAPAKGYWKNEKTWVPGETQTRWNPGHYADNGRWVEGRYQEFDISRGHWETRRVWVSRRGRY